ncbi:hypothetical protein L0152_14300 [bacterium]|nr:hypothetical protein [bacterium]
MNEKSKKDKRPEPARDPGTTSFIESDEAQGSSAIRGYEGFSPEITNQESEGVRNGSDVLSEEDSEWRDDSEEKEKIEKGE